MKHWTFLFALTFLLKTLIAQEYQEGVNFLTTNMTLGVYEVIDMDTRAHDAKCTDVLEKFTVGAANNEKWLVKSITKQKDKSQFLPYHKNLELTEEEYQSLKSCSQIPNIDTDSFKLRMALEGGIRKFQIEADGPENILDHFRMIPEDNQIMIGALTLYFQKNPANYYNKMHWGLDEVYTWYGEKKLNTGGQFLKEKYTVTIGQLKGSKWFILTVDIKSPKGAKSDNSGIKTWKFKYLRGN